MIVVIDDEPAVRESVSFLLDALGFTVRTYPSALAFLADPIEHEVLLIDHAMPGMTGVELLQKHPDLPRRVPTLLMSAYSEEIRDAATKAGVRQILEKPFSPDRLARALQVLIGPDGRKR